MLNWIKFLLIRSDTYLRSNVSKQAHAPIIRARHSIISLLGILTGQIALFGCVSIIGRVYGPEVLGYFNYQLALALFCGTLLGLRYELACVSNDSARSFNALVHVTLLGLVVTVIAVIVSVITYHARWIIVEIFSLAWFLQIAVGNYLNSLRWYGRIAFFRFFVNLGFFIYLLLDVKTHFVSGKYLFQSYVVLNIVVAIIMLCMALKHGKKENFPFRIGKEFFYMHNRFARYILPSTLCASVLTYALAILIPRWFDLANAGYFAVAYRLGFFPVSLVGQSLGGVLRRDAFAALGNYDASHALPRVFSLYARILIGIASVYVIGSVLLFGPLVHLFFGVRWNGAVELFYYLLPLFSLQIIYIPLSQVFLAINAQRTDFLFQFLCATILLLILVIGRILNFSIQESVLIFSAAGTILMFFGIRLTFLTVKGVNYV